MQEIEFNLLTEPWVRVKAEANGLKFHIKDKLVIS